VEPREAMEQRAFRQVVHELGAGHPQLEVSDSRLQLPESARRSGRAALLVFVAGRIAAAAGMAGPDRIVFGVNGDVDPGWSPDTPVFALRRLLMLRGLRAAMERDDLPRLTLPDPPPSKEHMWWALPDSLRCLVVSCTAPISVAPIPGSAAPARPVPCGHCSKCRWRQSRDDGDGCGLGAGPQQHVYGPGPAVAAGRGAEGEDLGSQAQPAVHVGLENRVGVR